jgi:hypothetical protein
MPYITQEARAMLEFRAPSSPGELNYEITKLINDYWWNHGQNYAAINDVVGALESAKAEFQRRIVAPYEDHKRDMNGDVY